VEGVLAEVVSAVEDEKGDDEENDKRGYLFYDRV
jgi:hypothetical protein